MKEKITLISTIILAILLVASLYYGFFIKPKEITYTSFIPTTFSTTKSITETLTSFITKTEKETRTTTYTKTETLITTYRIIKDEALILVEKNISSISHIGYGDTTRKRYGSELYFIVVNTEENTILIDKDLIVIKGKGDPIVERLNLLLPTTFEYIEGKEYTWKWYCPPIEKAILTPSNRTALFNAVIYFDTTKFMKEDIGKEHTAEIFITYKIIETNQFITFNSTLTFIPEEWWFR